MRAQLVVIEGQDHIGKSTQAKLLTQALKKAGSKARLVHAPVNDGVFYPVIRQMLATGSARHWPNVFQTLQFFNKLAFQLLVMPFLFIVNDYVVLDRWSLSAIVYGDASGSNSTYNRVLHFLLKKPDALLILFGDAHVNDRQKDSYETDVDLQREVSVGYLMWAAKHEEKCQMVDANEGIWAVHVKILDTLYRWETLEHV